MDDNFAIVNRLTEFTLFRTRTIPTSAMIQIEGQLLHKETLINLSHKIEKT